MANRDMHKGKCTVYRTNETRCIRPKGYRAEDANAQGVEHDAVHSIEHGLVLDGKHGWVWGRLVSDQIDDEARGEEELHVVQNESWSSGGGRLLRSHRRRHGLNGPGCPNATHVP